ncbi:SOS response-associated peptidase [Rhodococcus sp. BH2-1]|nr:SOS response-associated peptidase [Rhodococcus sp. BH2-1]
MCGRYASTTPDKKLRSLFALVESVGPAVPPSCNVAPTGRLASCSNVRAARSRQRTPSNSSGPLSGGLVPAWSKDLEIGSRLVNARSETITEKPSFRSAAAKRRCIIPADGYFE